MLTQTKTTTKQEFTTALRSGEYEQCFGGMFDRAGKFCAMGVLHAMNNDPEMLNMELTFAIRPSVFMHVADMNDTGSTFNEIADYLDGISDAEFSR